MTRMTTSAPLRSAGRTVSALTYYPDGSIASAKEPGDTERKFTYFPNGLIKSVTSPLGEATQFEYDARGNLVRETNALGGVTIRSYDPQNRLVKVTSPAEKPSATITTTVTALPAKPTQTAALLRLLMMPEADSALR